MIKNIRLLHYLSEDTYRNVNCALEAAGGNQKTETSFELYPDDLIFRIHTFNIIYKTFGHIWFLYVSANFPGFECTNEEFRSKLFGKYEELFGTDSMADFPSFENINVSDGTVTVV